MTTEEVNDEVEIADIVEACDLLTQRLEQYLEQLKAVLPTAEQDEDPRYLGRVERGIGWTEELLDAMDDVFEQLGSLRHNHSQLKWAREGKMV